MNFEDNTIEYLDASLTKLDWLDFTESSNEISDLLEERSISERSFVLKVDFGMATPEIHSDNSYTTKLLYKFTIQDSETRNISFAILSAFLTINFKPEYPYAQHPETFDSNTKNRLIDLIIKNNWPSLKVTLQAILDSNKFGSVIKLPILFKEALEK
ncbi:hypothetical protein ACRPK8_01705 [Exiguobacterium sp. TDN 0502]|uniref:hypothetical protein n=1 Tax=Exiguobacterium sp. TDN 0502 TaxID=3420731 RepID=UPI003D78A34A